jgi:hypothetical protein
MPRESVAEQRRFFPLNSKIYGYYKSLESVPRGAALQLARGRKFAATTAKRCKTTDRATLRNPAGLRTVAVCEKNNSAPIMFRPDKPFVTIITAITRPWLSLCALVNGVDCHFLDGGPRSCRRLDLRLIARVIWLGPLLSAGVHKQTIIDGLRAPLSTMSAIATEGRES